MTNHKMKKISWIIFFFLAVAAYPASSNASSWESFNLIETKPINEIWLNPGFYSYHFDIYKKLNNNNLGFGAEYRYSTVNSITAGRFYNSDRLISNYAAWYWQPFELGSIRLGALLGAIDGYPRALNGGWFPVIIPVASYEYKNVGINLTVVPTIINTVYGSITLQLKLKVL